MTRPAAARPEAERHVREGEASVARQAAIAEGFELAGDERAAEQAGETLALMRVNLGLAVFLLGIDAWATTTGRSAGRCRARDRREGCGAGGTMAHRRPGRAGPCGAARAGAVTAR